MLGLRLRKEFLGPHMPGTAISLRTSDNQGAAEKSPNHILSITYPTTDILTALQAISVRRSGRPIVLLGDRGRGKSHIMAVMHHAIQSPEVVESWLHEWGEKLGNNEMKIFEAVKGFVPISEPVHNYEYPFLWDLLFDRHPKGEYYRGQFEQISQSYPPRTLLEKMFEDQPTCLILDEFQTWFTGLPEKDPKTGFLPRGWAFNFIQNLSEIAKDRPEILILVISVLNNQNDAFAQVHRQGPVLVDFRGPTAKQDRQKLLLHRLFENRENILIQDIQNIAGAYASERFRLLYSDKSEAEKERIQQEVFECWPFSPELLELLEDHILLSQAAQETRDLIRILALVYRSRGDKTPIITPADFFVDDNSAEVQSLVDSIAVQAGQEKLREIAQRNLQEIRETGVNIPNARELISAIWMRSMSPGKNPGGTPNELHLDITRHQSIDDNAFQAELTLLVENSVNIHGDEVPGGPLWFGLNENPRSKVRACAKNNKLWQIGTIVSGQTVYPGKDIEHIRKTLRHIFVPETRQNISKVIILGPNWNNDPWSDVREDEKPNRWAGPVLLIVPEQIAGGHGAINACLGLWLVKHLQTRRNTVRFLLLASDTQSIYFDDELIFLARCSFLCSRASWGIDAKYRALHQDFDRQLRKALTKRFNRFAILRKWDFQNPQNCVFDIERISEHGQDIPSAVEKKILTDLFDQAEFKKFILKRAKDADFVGSVMDDLLEPPPPNNGDAIPYLGETKTYELILELAAQGEIALNVDGVWISRRPEDNSDEDARRYIKTKAFRVAQEMRKVQLGLPDLVGGGTIIAPKTKANDFVSSTIKPITQLNDNPPDISSSTATDTASPSSNNISPELVQPVVVSGIAEPGPITLQKTKKSKRSDKPATGLNLSGQFEKWGIPSSKTIEIARIEFQGLTAQQIRQILQRIPSSFKASLEIVYEEEIKE